ncbi:protoporphyrinogen oxidase [Arthrobacter sp. Hiyo4]|nr:protoporphyrinogen oxidase [Arthrobacter sp. Hiyo4]
MGSSVTPAQTAVVLGGGISGLLAARELAADGRAVTVLEATASWGGCVGSHVVAGLTLDSGAESFATRSPAVADLADELGLGSRVVAPRPGGAWVQLPNGPRELPRTGVLGIPANPWDPEVRRSLGFVGSLRASFDKYLPASLGASADVTSVAALVRARMAAACWSASWPLWWAACTPRTPDSWTWTWWPRPPGRNPRARFPRGRGGRPAARLRPAVRREGGFRRRRPRRRDAHPGFGPPQRSPRPRCHLDEWNSRGRRRTDPGRVARHRR